MGNEQENGIRLRNRVSAVFAPGARSSVKRGWVRTVHRALHDLEQLAATGVVPRVQVRRMESVHGRLVWDLEPRTPEVLLVVNEASDVLAGMCEYCGQPGQTDTWLGQRWVACRQCQESPPLD